MKQIEILVGLPASGKSTYAREKVQKDPNWVRINKDTLRDMLHNSKWSKDRERMIISVRDALIYEFIFDGKNIIIDDTNLHPKHIERIEDIADEHDYQVVINDSFLSVPYTECIHRDLQRDNPVGPRVINRMWQDFVWKPAEYIPGKTDVFICDLDGTIALRNGRSWFGWDKVDTDVVNENVATIISTLIRNGNKIIYLTGRDGSCYDLTKEWLINNQLWAFDSELYSRAEGDNRKDSAIKKELYENHIKDNYNVITVFDDRTQVVDMWRSLGLTCLQVNYGDF